MEDVNKERERMASTSGYESEVPQRGHTRSQEFSLTAEGSIGTAAVSPGNPTVVEDNFGEGSRGPNPSPTQVARAITDCGQVS